MPLAFLHISFNTGLEHSGPISFSYSQDFIFRILYCFIISINFIVLNGIQMRSGIILKTVR